MVADRIDLQVRAQEQGDFPVESVIAARITNGLTHQVRRWFKSSLSRGQLEEFDKGCERVVRGVLLECYIQDRRVTFPESDEFDDMVVRVTKE